MESSQRPMVSVYMLTYYHEKYLERAINSVLQQKRDFEIEIIISDDSSQDGTQEIIKRYAEKYSFIRVNINEKNIGITENKYLAKSLCTGKYVTSLPGDDYWIDPCKLQKQVDFLESHNDCLGVCTVVEARYDNADSGYVRAPKKKYWGKYFSLDLFLSGENYPLNGIMTKNLFLNESYKKKLSIMKDASKYVDDVTDCILFLQLGKIYILPDVCVAYRVKARGSDDKSYNSQMSAMKSMSLHLEMLSKLDVFFSGDIDLSGRFERVLGDGLYLAVKSGQISEFSKQYESVPQKYKSRNMLFRCITTLPARFLRSVKARMMIKLISIKHTMTT